MEGIHDIDDLLFWSSTISWTFFSFLISSSESVTASDINIFFSLDDHSGFDFEGNSLEDLCEFVRIGDELVTTEYVLIDFHLVFNKYYL